MPVLFYGDSGTGKELFAKLYMDSSPRTGMKMTVNCASYPDGLLRSEIFGHVKGAYTGSTGKRLGKIIKCNRGILFLDELGDASEEFQAAILRVVERYSFSAVGSDDEVKDIDTLVIAATLKPEQIRPDLKTRFHLLPVPPLQKTDIPKIARHFFNNRSLRQEVLADLMSREYPGNVRELKRYCERLLAEKGESIFSRDTTKANHSTRNMSDFDYERYRREIETWGKYIQPLIERLTLPKRNYEYMAWDSQIMKEPYWEHYLDGIGLARLLTHGYKQGDPLHLPEPEKNLRLLTYGEEKIDERGRLKPGLSMLDVIDKIEKDPTDDPEMREIFASHLSRYFTDRTLPYLLESLWLKKQPIQEESGKMFPAISSLLNCPLDEANKEFQKRYSEFNLERYRSNEAELEKATGRKKDSLIQIIRRAKKSEKQ
mgnify:CR=1 FL=1